MEENTKVEIPTVVLGVTLDENALKALSEGTETELIKGFVSQRTGKPFDAFLKITEGRLKYRFPERGELKKKTSSNFADKKQTVPTKVGGVELDEEDIEDLKAGKETKLIVGIESKKKGKYYDAYLKWNEAKGIVFRFPGMD